MTPNTKCPLCAGQPFNSKDCKYCHGTGEYKVWCVGCKQVMSWEMFYAYCATEDCPRFGLCSVVYNKSNPNP